LIYLAKTVSTINNLSDANYSSSAAEEEVEAEGKARKRTKEEESATTPARKSARLAKPN